LSKSLADKKSERGGGAITDKALKGRGKPRRRGGRTSLQRQKNKKILEKQSQGPNSTVERHIKIIVSWGRRKIDIS